jgi:hypothetical protein
VLFEMKAMTADSARAWLHFVQVFALTLVAALAGIYLLVLVLDPYDSGRITHNAVFGVVDENPRTASASRGRDPHFDSVVIGNSRGQLLDPKRLSDGTGLNFVQLTVPGTGPQEQLALLRWFIHHHRRIGAVLLVADPMVWCPQNLAPPANPFPFWLYSESTVEYSIHILDAKALDLAWRRTLLWLGLRTRSRPDGYWDYEAGRGWAFRPNIPDNFSPALTQARNPKVSFPAVELLRTALNKLDSNVPLAIVMPPAFFTVLPARDDPNADLIAQCKGALETIATQRTRGAFLDFEVDGEIARNPENFMDGVHYRAPIARIIEERVAAALSGLPVGKQSR